MFLPQLTSGPSSVSWSPDAKEVVYSMGGSLWRQKIDSTTAQQLTDGPGYDYQPDWSPDGDSIVYTSYQKDALELYLLDLDTGLSEQLTHGGAVNVEPRWSPDGKRIAFVSTSYNKRFHIFAGDVQDGELVNIVRLTGETKSSLPRYYYSAFDTEISPVWTRDNLNILFVSNRGHIYGSGGFWTMKAQPGAEAHEIHYEETTWKARPDTSPDGLRVVYSSYLGREWHQLWAMPVDGGDAFPLSYGDWDETNVRWSPDGKQLAFISNRSGNTQLWLQSIPGATQKQLKIAERRYLHPVTRLRIKVHDQKGQAIPARISILDAAGRFHAPEEAWINADDGYDRNERSFEAHYFHTRGEVDVEVPAGKIAIDVLKGFEQPLQHRSVTIVPGQPQQIDVALSLRPWTGLGKDPWVSSDLHVHMNYSGEYRNTPAHLVEQAEAENVSIIHDLIVNKEQRFPDIAYNGKRLDLASRPDALIVHGQEFHTSYWGHRGILNIKEHILLPGYAGYPNTPAASLIPMNIDVADMARAQGAIVGAVHPFEEEPHPFATPAEILTDEIPIDVALGKIDYMEILGFSDHRSTAAVWYRLLNLGFRVPAAAGTDAMANFASLRGPVGMNRTYANIPAGPLNVDTWLAALKIGRTFATNGPLLDFSLGEQPIGGELKFDAPQSAVPFKAALRSIVPLDHLEVVCNGQVAQALTMNSARDAAEVTGSVPMKESGWCLLRASTDKAEYPILDNYVYATTSPVYITIGNKKPHSPEDAKYFAAWIDRVIEATSNYPDWNSFNEKKLVLHRLVDTKALFEKMR